MNVARLETDPNKAWEGYVEWYHTERQTNNDRFKKTGSNTGWTRDVERSRN